MGSYWRCSEPIKLKYLISRIIIRSIKNMWAAERIVTPLILV